MSIYIGFTRTELYQLLGKPRVKLRNVWGYHNRIYVFGPNGRVVQVRTKNMIGHKWVNF